MKSAIVTTTIFVPTFLEAYAKNLKKYGHETSIVVVGDKKSPERTKDYCKSIDRCIYLDVEAQEKYLTDKGHIELRDHLPHNSISRSNVGRLMAYEAGADVIVMLDDDNLATNQDAMKHHKIVGQVANRPTFASTSGWFNVCKALVEKNGVEFYARGYPQDKKWHDGIETVEHQANKVAVNGGLWLNDPDIDALTRIERHLVTTGTNPAMPTSFALEPGTWSPWNCQNTAISRAALPSYFLSPHTGRHMDIWASYITTRVAEAMGEVITFGTPLVNHVRTPHNLYKDLDLEMPWIKATDHFVDTLRNIKISSRTYLGGFQEVIEGLRKVFPVDSEYIKGLQIWHDTMKRLGA